MPETERITIELPLAMIAGMDDIVEDETLGFADREEFLREAIRVMLVNYG